MGPMILVTIMIVVFIVITLMMVVGRYKKCPSDRIMVIYGRTGGQKRAARCIHGGAAFVWPVLQDYGFLSLRPLQIEVSLENALSKQNIRISTPSIFTVGISTDEAIMGNAAERLFGLHPDAISELARDIIFGQLRQVIASMTIEEINADRETFLNNVMNNVESELNKIGLKLINVNVKDITDESGYIAAIGKRAAAEVINKAAAEVAEEERKGRTGEAEARKAQRISVANAEALAASGEAEAKKSQRVAVANADAAAVSGEAEAQKSQRVAIANAEAEAASGEADADKNKRIAIKQADATAVGGENISAIEIAKSNAIRSEQEAEAFRKAEAARRIAEAEIERAKFEAEQKAQVARANMERERQRAEIIVPAEIRKQQIEIAAEAEAEKLRREARGQADAIYAKLEAEAKGNFNVLKAKGEGFKEIVQACMNDSNTAATMLLIEKLESIVELQTKAISNLKIDKITVWDGGSSADGKGATANFLSGMVKSLPPLHEVAGMAGIELPDYLGKMKFCKEKDGVAHAAETEKNHKA